MKIPKIIYYSLLLIGGLCITLLLEKGREYREKKEFSKYIIPDKFPKYFISNRTVYRNGEKEITQRIIELDSPCVKVTHVIFANYNRDTFDYEPGLCYLMKQQLNKNIILLREYDNCARYFHYKNDRIELYISDTSKINFELILTYFEK